MKRRDMLAGSLAALGAFVPAVGAQEAGSNDDDAGRVLGRADAPVEIVEYFSFSCPHCARFHREVLPALRERYIDTGRVRLVLRDFPLNLAALKAAAAAWCGGPARYLALVDAIWAGWETWIDEAEPAPALAAVLAAAGIAADEAARCLADPALEEVALESYLAGARDHGIDRTPTFLVDGERHAGFLSLDRLDALIGSAEP